MMYVEMAIKLALPMHELEEEVREEFERFFHDFAQLEDVEEGRHFDYGREFYIDYADDDFFGDSLTGLQRAVHIVKMLDALVERYGAIEIVFANKRFHYDEEFEYENEYGYVFNEFAKRVVVFDDIPAWRNLEEPWHEMLEEYMAADTSGIPKEGRQLVMTPGGLIKWFNYGLYDF